MSPRIVLGGRYNQKGKVISGIDWDQKNYPCGIPLIHFKPSELSDPHKQQANKLFLSHIFLILGTILNIVNNSYQVSQGQQTSRLISSFVFTILYNFLAGWTFKLGLRFFLENREKIVLYQSLNAFLVISYFCFIVLSFLNLNGFSRLGEISKLADVLISFEGLTFLILFFLSVDITFTAFSWHIGPANVLPQSQQVEHIVNNPV